MAREQDKLYFIEVYDEDVGDWEDMFPDSPSGTYHDMRAQIMEMKEVDEMNGVHAKYRLVEDNSGDILITYV